MSNEEKSNIGNGEIFITWDNIPQEEIMEMLSLYIENKIHTMNSIEYEVVEVEMKSNQQHSYANSVDRIFNQPYITFNFYDLKIKLKRVKHASQ
jgi:hypothetical protein